MPLMLEAILSAFFGLITLYACLRCAIITRPSRKKGWKKFGSYLLVVALLLGAVFSGWLLLEVVLFLA